MNRFINTALQGNSELQNSAAAIPESEEGGTKSLVDSIVEFDVTPYLNEPLGNAWGFLQDYPLLFAILLVAMGYG